MRVALLILALTFPLPSKEPAKQCKSFRFRISLSQGQNFEKQIGEGLTVKFTSEDGGDGWDISLVKKDNDYIYPANTPIRFNPTQFISPAYGQTLRDQTSNRSMKFLWKEDEYQRITMLEQDVLWPYQAKDPDKATADYLSALNHASMGELRLMVRDFKAEKDRLKSIEFDVEMVVPNAFTTSDTTQSATCPVMQY